jgi:hypothetical protein
MKPLHMKNAGDPARKFSNRRQWREFIAAIHESATAVTAAAWSTRPSAEIAREPLGMRINIAMSVAQEADQRKA